MFVLVRPEAIDIVIGSGITQHGAGDGAALPLSVVVVLHSQPPEDRMLDIGYVARREDTGHVRPALRIDENAVFHGNRAPRERIHIWRDADAHYYQIAVKSRACFGQHALRPAVA